MVTVCMLREKGRAVGFTASGHAEYGPKGGDIVCSAVSALTQTAVLGLTEKLQLPAGVEVNGENGIHCVLGKTCTSAQLRDAQIILDTMLLGLEAIQRAYGDTLIITEREV